MTEENEFTPPTYEEYKKATQFARIRYKYGLFVTIIASILLIALIFFILFYSKELRSNPLIYGAKKWGVTCECESTPESGLDYSLYINSTTMHNRIKDRSISIMDLSKYGENVVALGNGS